MFSNMFCIRGKGCIFYNKREWGVIQTFLGEESVRRKEVYILT